MTSLTVFKDKKKIGFRRLFETSLLQMEPDLIFFKIAHPRIQNYLIFKRNQCYILM